jgi:hypothetical protein
VVLIAYNLVHHLCRAERSEIAAQPTLSTTAKRQQLAQAQAQRASAAKAEDDAPKPLKWTCVYSFKYRYVHL